MSQSRPGNPLHPNHLPVVEKSRRCSSPKRPNQSKIALRKFLIAITNHTEWKKRWMMLMEWNVAAIMLTKHSHIDLHFLRLCESSNKLANSSAKNCAFIVFIFVCNKLYNQIMQRVCFFFSRFSFFFSRFSSLSRSVSPSLGFACTKCNDHAWHR